MRTEKQHYFEEIYEKYKGTVYKYVLVSLDMNESLANDCMQDIFIVAYGKVDELIFHPNPGGFLIVTARNFIRKYKEKQVLQSKRTVHMDESVTNLAYEENFDRFLEDSVDVEILKREFLELLSPQELALYTMFYENREPIAKISNILEISESNVKVRLYRLRIKVKQLIKTRFSGL